MAKAVNRILLVEGKDDKHVLWSLLQAHNVPNNFVIKAMDDDDDSGGWQKLLNVLDLYIDTPKLERLGIILDADESLQDRWNTVSARLSSQGYRQIPTLPEHNGTIIQESGKPIIGVWLMPNNQTHGILEDFIAFLVPNVQKNWLWQYVDQSIAAIPEHETRFPPVRKSKALIHTWLAWQEEPGKPLGQAITAKYMDAQATEAKTLIGWLDRLFNQPYATPVF